MTHSLGRYVCVLSVLAILITGSSAQAYRRPGVTTIETVSSTGQQADYTGVLALNRSDASPGCPQRNGIRLAAMTPNGRYLAFVSAARNLVPNDTNLICDVFVRDRVKGTTTRASVGAYGLETIGLPATGIGTTDEFSATASTTISPDGNLVVFSTSATNVVPGDTDMSLDVFVRNIKKGTTRLVSTAADDPTPEDYRDDMGNTFGPAISGDGRYVSFHSQYHDAAGGIDASHVFVKDLQTGELEEIQPPQPGSYEWAYGSSMTRDGNIVVLTAGAHPSRPESLVLPHNVFIVNRSTDKTEVACLRPDGERGENDAYTAQGPTITPDGRYLLFQSDDAGWVPNDSNRTRDEYVCDLTTGRVRRVTVTSIGGEATGSPGYTDSLSPDGRYVQYSAQPFNLGPMGGGCFPACLPSADLDGVPSTEIYLYDTHAGVRELLSSRTDQDGSKGCPAGVFTQSVAGPLSLDARFAAFWSCNSNIVEGDSNENWDLFLRDRGEDVSAAMGDGESTFEPEPSEICIADEVCIPPLDYLDKRDGQEDVSKALTELGANLYGVSIANRAESGDLFVRVELEKMPSVNGVPLQGTSLLYGLGFEAGGASYEIRAQRTPGPDFDPAGGASFGLFKKDAATGPYTKVATLRGGYGTTGVEIVFALPLSEIGLEAGGRISNVTAFTGLGTYLSGATRILDSAVLN